jgi:hypothetical protein
MIQPGDIAQALSKKATRMFNRRELGRIQTLRIAVSSRRAAIAL